MGADAGELVLKMMKRILAIVWAFAVLGIAAADEARSSAAEAAGAERAAVSVGRMPWVGLKIGPLDGAIRAHAGEVPEGVGFLVDGVDDGGPAAKAGIRAYDILWKFDDQLLVNQSQFATLLRLREPGETVTFSVVRSARHREVEVTLKAMPDGRRRHGAGPSPEEIPLVPTGVPGMPRTIVYPQNRTAEVSRADGGVAKLFYADGEARVSIVDAEGESVYEGPVREGREFRVPKDWHCSVGALLRTMSQAEKSDWKPRRPRPRVVTPDSADGG
jgi:hypothetical protein